jgi:adenylate cyclase
VRGEAREGAERGILVPVRFERAEMPIDVRTFHTTDLDDWSGDPQGPQVQEVIHALGGLIARKNAARAATETSGVAGSASAPGPARVAICVLPFANMSGDPEQEYFSDGITEDIITDLSKVSALAVISRNSAFVFKGKHVDVLKVARELKVDRVLEGSVRKAGGRVRITAQLVDGSTNDHLWAERYDRDLNDIFALQDEISEAIVKALRLRLLPEERQAIEHRGTDNVEAYNLYLMGAKPLGVPRGLRSPAPKCATIYGWCTAFMPSKSRELNASSPLFMRVRICAVRQVLLTLIFTSARFPGQ